MIYTPDTTVSYLRNKFSALRLETCPPVAQGLEFLCPSRNSSSKLEGAEAATGNVCGCAMTCDMEDGRKPLAAGTEKY